MFQTSQLKRQDLPLSLSYPASPEEKKVSGGNDISALPLPPLSAYPHSLSSTQIQVNASLPMRTIPLRMAYQDGSLSLRKLLFHPYQRAHHSQWCHQTVTMVTDTMAINYFIHAFQHGILPKHYFHSDYLPLALSALDHESQLFTLEDFYLFSSVSHFYSNVGGTLLCIPIFKGDKLTPTATTYFSSGNMYEGFTLNYLLDIHRLFLQNCFADVTACPSVNQLYFVTFTSKNILRYIYSLALCFHRKLDKINSDCVSSVFCVHNFSQMSLCLHYLLNDLKLIKHQVVHARLFDLACQLKDIVTKAKQLKKSTLLKIIVRLQAAVLDSVDSSAEKTIIQQGKHSMGVLAGIMTNPIPLCCVVKLKVQKGYHVGLVLFHPHIYFLMSRYSHSAGVRVVPVTGILTTHDIGNMIVKDEQPCAVYIPGLSQPKKIGGIKSLTALMHVLHDYLLHAFNYLFYPDQAKKIMHTWIRQMQVATHLSMSASIWRLVDRAAPVAIIDEIMNSNQKNIVTKLILYFANFMLSRDSINLHVVTPVQVRLTKNALHNHESALAVILIARHLDDWLSILTSKNNDPVKKEDVLLTLNSCIKPKGIFDKVMSLCNQYPYASHEFIIVTLFYQVLGRTSMETFFDETKRHSSLIWSAKGGNLELSSVAKYKYLKKETHGHRSPRKKLSQQSRLLSHAGLFPQQQIASVHPGMSQKAEVKKVWYPVVMNHHGKKNTMLSRPIPNISKRTARLKALPIHIIKEYSLIMSKK